MFRLLRHGVARGGVDSLRVLSGWRAATGVRAHGRFAQMAAFAMLCLCFVGPSRPAVAAVECRIWWGTLPGQDPLDRFPTYFSGTRCAVVAEVRTTTPGAMLSWVRISVGGQQTKYVQLYPYVFVPYVYVQSRFASTFFPDGTSIQVTAEAADTMGQYGVAAPRSSTALSVWGDYYTRLWGLYTAGNTLASGIWHD